MNLANTITFGVSKKRIPELKIPSTYINIWGKIDYGKKGSDFTKERNQ